MESKSLLFGIIGFLLGGLLVSIVASTAGGNEMTMNQMVDTLKTKSGEEFDKAFVASMIEHHQAAVDMAELSATRAKHNEIKHLSTDIINAQKNEINQMKAWQVEWGFESTTDHSMKSM